jgi:hypothetical protein
VSLYSNNCTGVITKKGYSSTLKNVSVCRGRRRGEGGGIISDLFLGASLLT